MKKIINISTLVAVLILCFAASVNAASYESFNYTENSDGTAKITSYSGEATKIVIPETVDGITVTSIGELAFYENLTVKEIVLPETVKEIEMMAFQGCAYLEKINLHEGLEIIGERAFSECRNLYAELSAKTELEDPQSVFASCKGVNVSPENPYYSNDSYGVLFNKDKTELISYPAFAPEETYTVPATVKIIGDTAFVNAINLKSIILPEGLEKIGYEAIAGAILLEVIEFPSSLKEIGDTAFFDCVSLNNIVITNTIETIGFGAFANCFSLDKIEIKSLDTVIGELAIGYADRLPAVKFDEWLQLSYAFATSIHGTQEYKTNRQKFYNATFIPEEGITICESTKILCHSDSSAETYAIENGINYELKHFMGEWTYDWENYTRERKCSFCSHTETEALEKNVIGDVEIVNPEDPNTSFEVEDLEKSNNFIVVEETVKDNLGTDFTVLKAFDITLNNKDGVHVQPNGTVKVKLPLDWDKSGNYKVYRVNDDGTLTDMNAYRQGSHMVFDTNHFSIYVIVAENEQVPEEENTSESPNLISKLFDLLKDFFALITKFFNDVIIK